jgi:hypothetical protein
LTFPSGERRKKTIATFEPNCVAGMCRSGNHGAWIRWGHGIPYFNTIPDIPLHHFSFVSQADSQHGARSEKFTERQNKKRCRRAECHLKSSLMLSNLLQPARQIALPPM